MARPTLAQIGQLASLALLGACGDGGGGNGPTGTGGNNTPVVSSVVISGSQLTLTSLGETVTLTAQARDASGNTISGKTFTWMSSDMDVATVSSAGVVTAVANGSATITAATDGVNGTATVTVTAPDMASVSTGNFHACSVTRNGTAYCWGDNTNGQLGDGSNTASTRPVPVAGGLRFVQLTSGARYHTCGLTAEGEGYCWGENGFGQLGDGTTTNSNVPVRAAGSLVFTTIDAGPYNTCGLISTGEAYCWGANGPSTQTFGDRDGPGYALGAPTTELCANPAAPYRGSFWPCSPTPLAVSGNISFRSISAGVWATCGVAVSGEAYCWGFNGNDNLGTGTAEYATAPTPVAGGLLFDGVVQGGFHACGLVNDDAYCWGARLFNWGQLGIGSFVESNTPAPVVGGLIFSAVIPTSANNVYMFTCGLTTAGATYCWGAGRFGGLGTDVVVPSCTQGDVTFPCSNVPVPVAGGIEFISVATGNEFACGVGRNTVVYCWGRNDSGQLGDGMINDAATPVRVLPPER